MTEEAIEKLIDAPDGEIVVIVGNTMPLIHESSQMEIDEKIRKIVNKIRDEEVKPDIVIGE